MMKIVYNCNFADVGYPGYILLYGITLYRVSEETLSLWNITEQDRYLVIKVGSNGKYTCINSSH